MKLFLKSPLIQKLISRGDYDVQVLFSSDMPSYKSGTAENIFLDMYTEYFQHFFWNVGSKLKDDLRR